MSPRYEMERTNITERTSTGRMVAVQRDVSYLKVRQTATFYSVTRRRTSLRYQLGFETPACLACRVLILR